jgi:uncharacterized protein YndB with AHSA1/START domain
MTQPGTIHLTQHVPHPPARVWAALSEPELHARWWAAGDVRPVVGHRFTLDMGPWGQQPCEVLAVEPGRMISYSFAPGTLDSTITWRIEPDGDGARLTLDHAGFDLDSPLGRKAYEGMAGGWPRILANMGKAIAAA